MFLNAEDFPFTRILESRWQVIRDELANIPKGGYLAWPERFLYGEGWDVFGLYGFGKRLDGNCRLCPETARAVEAVPGMVTAGFSSLEAGTHIVPHRGYSTQVLRCHLGLIVPEDGCALRVADETRAWREGQCLVFDDTAEHEAWNRSASTRIVLLLDFTRPGVTYQPSASPEVARILNDLTSDHS